MRVIAADKIRAKILDLVRNRCWRGPIRQMNGVLADSSLAECGLADSWMLFYQIIVKVTKIYHITDIAFLFSMFRNI